VQRLGGTVGESPRVDEIAGEQGAADVQEEPEADVEDEDGIQDVEEDYDHDHGVALLGVLNSNADITGEG